MSDQRISLSRGERFLGLMPESQLMPPAVTMMPHALMGTHDLHEMARYAVENLAATSHTMEEEVAYREDLFGSTPQDKLHFQQGLRAFYERLRRLPNQSTILLTLEPDGICAATCVGRHCMRLDDGGDRKTDLEAIEHVASELDHFGFKRGKDWDMFAPTPHTLYDVSGVGLSVPTVAIPRAIQLPSLVARAGALRHSM